MPKELEVTRAVDELTDEELDAALIAVKAILAPSGAENGDCVNLAPPAV